MAIVRNNAIAEDTQRNLAEFVLNQLLHRPLEESFATMETGLHDESLVPTILGSFASSTTSETSACSAPSWLRRV